jgi:hypothetical protein
MGRKLRRFAYGFLHVSSLAVTAWVLLADSYEGGSSPAHPAQCYAGWGGTVDLTLADAGVVSPASTLEAGALGHGSIEDAATAASDAATPADAGESDAATPADAGESDAATPADAGESDAATPADAGESDAATPADAGEGDAAAEVDATDGDAGRATSGSVDASAGEGDGSAALKDAAAHASGGTVDAAVGPMLSSDAGAPMPQPSCASLDGIGLGGRLVFSLTEHNGDVPDGGRATDGGVCAWYQAQNLEGFTTVSINGTAQPPANVLTEAVGEFTLPAEPSCRGAWTLTIVPSAEALASQPIMPPEAGAAGWSVTRTIQIDQAQFCRGVFSVRGPVTCSDTFPIANLRTGNP